MAKKYRAAKKPVNFFVWLRSGLRKLSRTWPPIYEALAAAKVPYKGDNKRRQWSYICAACQQPQEGKNVAVDHVQGAGSLLCKEDIADFVERLFCPVTELQVLCHSCHSCKTYVERYGGTLDDARLQLEVVAICKKPVSDVKQFCYDYGYTDAQLSNLEKRRGAVEEILRRVK